MSNKHWGEIGRVVPTGQDTFLWQISEFSGLPKEIGAKYWSPIMILSESEWTFEIYPNGEKEVDEDQILLILQRWRYSRTKIHCTVAVRHADGTEEPGGTDTVWPEEDYAEFFLRPFSTYADKSVDASTLTITVCLREEGKGASQIPTSRVKSRHGEEIGHVVPRGQDTFLWEIPELSGLSKVMGTKCLSPIIELPNSAWRFKINMDVVGFAARRPLYLWRWDDSRTKTHCTVAVRRADEKEEAVATNTIMPDEDCVQYFMNPFYRCADECEAGGGLSPGTHTIIVCLREEGEAVSQGGALTSQEIQMEDLSSMIKSRDDSNEEKSSPLEATVPTSSVSPRHGGEIGHIVPTGQDTYVWEIPGFLGLPKKVGTRYRSPLIELQESAWSFEIYPNGQQEGDTDRIALSLTRDDDSCTTVQCTVAVRHADGKEGQVGTDTFLPGEEFAEYYIPYADKCGDASILSSGTLTIIVCLREEEGEAVSQGGGILTSQKIQIEDLSSVNKSQDGSNEEKSSPLEATVPTSRVSPSHREEIGHIIPRGQDTFVWEIPGFLGLPKKVGTKYWSPVTKLQESEWSLDIYPNGVVGVADRILLCLWRWDDNRTKIDCTVAVSHTDGTEEVRRNTIPPLEHYGEFLFSKYVDNCEESSTLNIIVCLREEGETATQGAISLPSMSAFSAFQPQTTSSAFQFGSQPTGNFVFGSKNETPNQIPSSTGVALPSSTQAPGLVFGSSTNSFSFANKTESTSTASQSPNPTFGSSVPSVFGSTFVASPFGSIDKPASGGFNNFGGASTTTGIFQFGASNNNNNTDNSVSKNSEVNQKSVSLKGVMKEVLNIKDAQREQSETMHDILTALNSLLDRFPLTQPIVNDAPALPGSLPLQSMEELSILETALSEDSHLKEHLCEKLNQVGRTSLGNTIRRMLMKLVSNKLAWCFSLLFILSLGLFGEENRGVKN